MYQFTISVKNDFRPEIGVNIAVKGLGDKLILQPQEIRTFEQKQDGNTLVFTLIPSSGGTESPRTFSVEVTNGTEKTTTEARHWEVALTASDATVNATVTAGCDLW